jgi:hypothetical protein
MTKEACCPQCGSKSLYKDGLRYLKDGDTVQRWLCRDCGYRFSDPNSNGDYSRRFSESTVQSHVEFSGIFECSMCGARGPRQMFDVHHICYDPEITVILCASCHAIITRTKLSPEAQFQLKWTNEKLKFTLIAYQRRLSQLKTEISRLEKLKASLENGVFDVKRASSHEELVLLISKGYEPVVHSETGVHILRRPHRRIDYYFR